MIQCQCETCGAPIYFGASYALSDGRKKVCLSCAWKFVKEEALKANAGESQDVWMESNCEPDEHQEQYVYLGEPKPVRPE